MRRRRARQQQPCSLQPGAATVCRGAQLPVECEGVHGMLLLCRHRAASVLCDCAECRSMPHGDREYTCGQFEKHACSARKNWKQSMRVRLDGDPEAPEGGRLLFEDAPCRPTEPDLRDPVHSAACLWHPLFAFTA